ncbi:MAG: ATP-binding protein [Treponema sp.]|nr:ATP-binding protein [Treponema sp.]
MKELLIKAIIENIDTVLDFTDEILKDCPPKVRNEIGLVTDEIFSNIARYAYTPNIGDAVIRVNVVNNEIIIEFEDSGIPYNPLENDDPDISVNIIDREIGGLGIFMTKKIMDNVKYEYKNNRNIFTAIKKIS